MNLKQKTKNFISANWPPNDAFIAKKVRKKLNENLDPDDLLFSRIGHCLSTKQSLLIGRIGGSEARVIGAWYRRQELKNFRIKLIFNLLWPGPYGKRAKQLQKGAGFYPIDHKSIDKFVNLYSEIIPEIDILGAWGKAFAWPEYLVKSSIPFIPLESLSPWVDTWSRKVGYGQKGELKQHHPWSEAFNDKKILVVTPFSDSASSQLARINLVFPDFYPKMRVTFVKAPMTMGGATDGYSWFEKLEKTKFELEKNEFEIALVSAGSYSLPIAAHAKKMGKIGIHTGGALQLFFGILGKRWENEQWLRDVINEFWIRPSTAETPKVAGEVEDGCYW